LDIQEEPCLKAIFGGFFVGNFFGPSFNGFSSKVPIELVFLRFLIISHIASMKEDFSFDISFE